MQSNGSVYKYMGKEAKTNAMRILDKAGIPWRIAVTSRSLNGIWAAASAGLGVALRTTIGMPASLQVVDCAKLPAAGDIGVGLYGDENRLTGPAKLLLHTITACFALHMPPTDNCALR